MALIVVMPVLSRAMPMALMPGMDGDCPVHQAASTKHPDGPQAPVDPTERCGYCSLLNHTPPLTPDTAIHFAPVAPVAAIVPLLRIDEKPASPRLSADPRGPPHIG